MADYTVVLLAVDLVLVRTRHAFYVFAYDELIKLWDVHHRIGGYKFWNDNDKNHNFICFWICWLSLSLKLQSLLSSFLITVIMDPFNYWWCIFDMDLVVVQHLYNFGYHINSTRVHCVLSNLTIYSNVFSCFSYFI